MVGGRSYSRLQEVVGSRRKQHLKPARVRGFTIVELLIVIVVIGILAAISIVAYNGISQKANNAAIIQAASNSLKVIQAYIAQEGKYPRAVISSVNECITVSSRCTLAADSEVTQSETFRNNMSSIGNIPLSIPNSGDVRNGILYQYTAARMIDGVSRPAKLIYWLQGTNQACGLPGVVASSDTTMLTSGYTTANEWGKTRCDVLIPGPAA